MIRKATKKDIDTIMNIWLNTNRKAHDFISEEYWESHFEEVKTAVLDAEVYVFEDTVIKGFVGVTENYIAGLFVKEEFQSQGIGKALIQHLQGLKSQLVLQVYEKNERAVDFYKKNGFQISQKQMEDATKQIEYQMIWNRKMKCKIRKWKLTDARVLALTISNPRIQDNLRDGLPYPYTERDAEEYISAMLAADENDTFAFAIDVDGKAVGSIGIFRQGNIHRQTAELGYYIAEEYWRQGIMTDAVKQICEFVFNNCDIIRIYAEPFAYNMASCRVLEKAGFQYEGTLRNNAVKNGKILDMKMYSIIKY